MFFKEKYWLVWLHWVLWQADLSLQHMDCEGFVAPPHVGYLFLDQGLNLHTLLCKADSNHWTIREVPGLHL